MRQVVVLLDAVRGLLGAGRGLLRVVKGFYQGVVAQGWLVSVLILDLTQHNFSL